jgi:hypothetical protein
MDHQAAENELTKEEIDRRARELARRVMSMPPKPRVKGKAVQTDEQKPVEPPGQTAS